MKKFNNTVAYLTEPASYTQELVKSVHERLFIKYRYLQKQTKHANNPVDSLFLSEISFVKRIRILHSDFKNHEKIIFNGYNRLDFWVLWFFQLFSSKKRLFFLESDTTLKIPKNRVKRLVKKSVLNYLFTKKYVFGLSGGEHKHKDHFKFYGMSDDRIYFVPMVSNIKKFKGYPRKYKIPFVLLFVGRFVSLKNIEFLLINFEKFLQNDSTIKLRLVGDGPLKNDLQKKYAHLSNVRFVGKKFNDDLINEYKKASALVLPSYKEQWGLVINEAMASGLPVMANKNVGAIDDLIVNRETGFVFDYEKPEDFINHLTKLREQNTYEMFSKNAYLLLNDYWNYNLYYEKIIDALKKNTNEKYG